MTTPLLEVENLHVSYGSAKALFGVSLTLEAGKVLSVLGPNGAGKSTLARTLSRLVPVSSGRIRFDGQDITKLPPHQVRRLGLAQAPEGRGLFPSLSVLENLRMATRIIDSRPARKAAVDRALSAYPVLSRRKSQRAGTLSGGEQQMLSLAVAQATNARLLIVDELSLGLAPLMVDEVFASIGRIKQTGVSIVIIEQFVDRALALSDDCLVLQHGSVSWRGSSVDARADIGALYLGEAQATAAV